MTLLSSYKYHYIFYTKQLEWIIIFGPNLQSWTRLMSRLKLLSQVQPKTSINLQGFGPEIMVHADQ